MFASPFDEALERPFIGQDDRPQPKKFSWTSTVATVFTIDDDDDDSYESYEAPTGLLQRAVLKDLDDELSLEDVYDNEKAPLVTVDLERAVLKERHSDIIEITSDMKHINEIQQDLANVVDSQESDIKRMSWLAIEAFEETKGGLEQLQRASNVMEVWIGGRRRQRGAMMSLLFGLALLAAYAFKKLGESPESYDGDPQKFP